MPTDQQGKQRTDRGQQECQQRYAVIGKHVIHALGQPPDLHRVQVRPLWEDHYRVNVLVGTDAAAAKVAHSYFLVTDDDGNVIASTPGITKHY
jgi:hypothetical protein